MRGLAATASADEARQGSARTRSRRAQRRSRRPRGRRGARDIPARAPRREPARKPRRASAFEASRTRYPRPSSAGDAPAQALFDDRSGDGGDADRGAGPKPRRSDERERAQAEWEKSPERADKPNSVPRPEGEAAIIPLGPRSPSGSSSRPGDSSREVRRDGRPLSPYLALLRMGFTVPPPLPAERCALTAPFHPCRPFGRRFVFCGTFLRVAATGGYPACCPCGVRTFLSGSSKRSPERSRGPLGAVQSLTRGSARLPKPRTSGLAPRRGPLAAAVPTSFPRPAERPSTPRPR